MGETTGIEWCDSTLNLWWGCTKVGGSPACDNCYAEAWSKRTGFNVWGTGASRRYFPDRHLDELFKWDDRVRRANRRARVFVMSMGDWAEGRPEQRPVLNQFFSMAEKFTNLDLLMLTKRPQLIKSLIPESWLKNPLPHVWMGTTIENSYWVKNRWEHLRQVPAAVHWFSMEPLASEIELPSDFLALGKKAWVIVGGESGNGARPMNPAWVRSLRDQSVCAGVPFHFKQWGDLIAISECKPSAPGDRRITMDGIEYVRLGKKVAGRILDGRTWDELPLSAPSAPEQPEELPILQGSLF
jgi:protein gp37